MTVTPAALLVIVKAPGVERDGFVEGHQDLLDDGILSGEADGIALAVGVSGRAAVDDHRGHGRRHSDAVDDLRHRRRRTVAAGVGRVAVVDREEIVRADGQVGDGEGDGAAAEGRRGDDGVGVARRPRW